MVVKPYTDYKVSANTFIRTFNCDELNEQELVWHRDKLDRSVEVLEGLGWQFQYDNELPSDINEGDTIFIMKNSFHRILKGKTNLKIKITEYGG